MNKCRFAIDLLWVRPNKVGGVESYIRNILDGLLNINENFEAYLIVSIDNCETFQKYSKDKRFIIIRCNVQSEHVPKRIIWQNCQLGKKLKDINVDVCFEPHNYIPFFRVRHVKFIATIHDLQLIHYPENFDLKKRMWFKFNWANTIKKAKRIIVISNFVKEDLLNNYPKAKDKTNTIYNSIIVNDKECDSEEQIKEKFGVERNEFYYTVASLMPHKNLKTIIDVIDEIKGKHINLPSKLLISGVGGKLENELIEQLKEKNLNENIQLTGYVKNSERNALYKNCRAFLFPSVFEGFGMPNIEASYMGARVITTKESCMLEVTQGKAEYVNNPYDKNEWIEIMSKEKDSQLDEIDFERYSIKEITQQYFNLIKGVCNC